MHDDENLGPFIGWMGVKARGADKCCSLKIGTKTNTRNTHDHAPLAYLVKDRQRRGI